MFASGATPAPTTTPFSSARLVLTTSTGGGRPKTASTTAPPPTTTPAHLSARPLSAAIPLLTEIRRRVGLGGGAPADGTEGGASAVHSLAQLSTGAQRRWGAAPSPSRIPATAGATSIGGGGGGGSLWTVSKRDVRRRRALASEMEAPKPADDDVGFDVDATAAATVPTPAASIGRGLLRRFNAAWALSFRRRGVGEPRSAAAAVPGEGGIDDAGASEFASHVATGVHAATPVPG